MNGKMIILRKNAIPSGGKGMRKEEAWRVISSAFTGETTGITGTLSASWRKWV
jgi:hypothetical protein